MKNLIAFIAAAGLAFGMDSSAQPVPPSQGDLKLTEAALAKLSLEEKVAQRCPFV